MSFNFTYRVNSFFGNAYTVHVVNPDVNPDVFIFGHLNVTLSLSLPSPVYIKPDLGNVTAKRHIVLSLTSPVYIKLDLGNVTAKRHIVLSLPFTGVYKARSRECYS